MSQSIDIMEQFVGQFKKENVLGFFQFHHAVKGRKALTGLCKIARSKDSSSKVRYISLVFLVDTPDNDAQNKMDEVLNKLTEQAIKKYLREVESVTPMPKLSTTPESYVKHLDMILAPGASVDKEFVEDKLMPVIRSVAGFTATEDLIWWDDLDTPQDIEENMSLLDRVKNFFKPQV